MTDEITSLLAGASNDERAAFTIIARKVMGQGRRTYGPASVANDPRDFRREAADEITDAVWYWALDEVRRMAQPTTPDLLSLVRSFQLAAKQPLPSTPTVDDRDLNEFCVNLLDEEVGEVEVALAERDVPGALKELIDVVYIALGNVEKLGYGHVFYEAFWAVHVSNMAKVIDGVHMNAAGKIQKPPGWVAPDLASIIAAHRSREAFDDRPTGEFLTVDRVRAETERIRGRLPHPSSPEYRATLPGEPGCPNCPRLEVNSDGLGDGFDTADLDAAGGVL